MRIVLQQRAEFLNGQAGIVHDPAQRQRVDRIVAGNSEDARAIRHERVLAFAGDPKADLVKRADGPLMADASDFQEATSTSRISSPWKSSS